MKSILLYANEDAGLEARLQAALDLARCFSAHLLCVQTTSYDAYVVGDPFGGVFAVPELIEQVNRARGEARERLERRLAGEGAAWTWLEVSGEPGQGVVDRSGLADIILLSLPGGAEDRERRRTLAIAGETIVHARTPVLAIPAGWRRLDVAGTAMVAWNGSLASCLALRAAVPLLKQAAGVHVVTVKEDLGDFPATQACEYLAWHGLKAELVEEEYRRDVAAALLAHAQGVDAAYLVAGAFGHSRLREAVLGGTTRALLTQAKLPLLLGH